MRLPHPRAWLRRARSTADRVDDVHALAAEQRELLLRDLHLTTTNDSRLHRLTHDVEDVLGTLHGFELEQRLAELLGRLHTLGRHIDAPAKEAAAARLVASLGPPAPLTEGLGVLIPAWNHATRLDRALASARAVVPAEHITVLDDASTDSTAAVLAGHPDIRVIRSEENLGLTRARNVLLHAATTTRVLFLDADNRLDPETLPVLDAMAVEWAATVAHGALIEVDQDDRPTGLLSAGPLDGSYFAMSHNRVDSLAIVDLAAVRAAGGYTLDPVLETSEDWDMWHRLASRGGFLLYVPCVVGRKLRVSRGHNSQPQDHGQQFKVIDRTYRFDDQLDDSTVAAAVIHPATGPLWASTAAIDARPRLAASLPERFGQAGIPPAAAVQPAPLSVLVVGAGGVRNLGDDATTTATIRRLRALLDPAIGIEVITDGARPSGSYEPGVWLGTIREFAQRPLDHHAAVIMSGGGNLTSQFPDAGTTRHAVAEEARRSGVPLLLTGQGLGPFEGDPVEIRSLLRQAIAVSVRDPHSHDLAVELGATDVTVLGDDATPADLPAERPPALGLVAAEGWLAFNGRLSSYSGVTEDDLAGWARAVDEAAGRRGLDVVAVAQNRQPPWELATMSTLADRSRHAAWHVIDVTDDLPLAHAVYGQAAGVVARSYHAAWFALAGGVPALLPATGPYYRAKAAGLAALLDLPAELGDDTVPADGADLDRRLAAVAPLVERRPLADVDGAITAWLADQLAAMGVPLAAGYPSSRSASTSPSTTVT